MFVLVFCFNCFFIVRFLFFFADAAVASESEKSCCSFRCNSRFVFSFLRASRLCMVAVSDMKIAFRFSKKNDLN